MVAVCADRMADNLRGKSPASSAKLYQPIGGSRSGDCRGSVADNRGFISWLVLDQTITDDVVRNFGYYSSIRQWFIIPYLIAPIAVLVLYLTYRAWRERWWSLLGRVHYTLVALSLVWSLVFLRLWEFIGP